MTGFILRFNRIALPVFLKIAAGYAPAAICTVWANPKTDIKVVFIKKVIMLF